MLLSATAVDHAKPGQKAYKLTNGRDRREAARRQVATGEDPGLKRQKEAATAKALEEETFGFVGGSGSIDWNARGAHLPEHQN